MTTRAWLFTALLTLPVLAFAQESSLPEIPPVPPSEGVPTPVTPIPVTPPGSAAPAPAPVNPAPVNPGAVNPGTVNPATLNDVSANLFVPRTVTGTVNLTFTVRSARTTPITFSVRRDNDQDCATAPLVRVLRVGSREVVYPRPGEPRLCAQDMQTKTASAKGNVSFTRELNLPPGDYMIESWLSGFANNTLVKVPAAPMRVTVN